MALAEEPIIPVFTRGDRLAKAREVAGFTQQAMADRLDVKRTTLAAGENDASQPRDVDWVMTRYHEETGVELAWLYGFRTGSYSTPLEVVTNDAECIAMTLPFARHLTPV